MTIQGAGDAQRTAPIATGGGGVRAETQPAPGIGQDRFRRDGSPRMTREEWAREFQKGFNRGADKNETMAVAGFFGGAIGGTMLAYGLTTAGVSLAVPLIGGALAIGGLALLGIGLYNKLKH